MADFDFCEDMFLALSKPRAGNEGTTPESFAVFVEEINYMILDFLGKIRETHHKPWCGVCL